MALPGSFLVVWEYYLNEEASWIAWHFIALDAGFIAAVFLGQRLGQALLPRTLALCGCLLIAVGCGALGFCAPPVAAEYRLMTLGLLGAGGGIVATAIVYRLARSMAGFGRFRASAFQTVAPFFAAGGILIGLVGALLTITTHLPVGTAAIGTLPAAALVTFWLSPQGNVVLPAQTPHSYEPVGVRKVAAALLALLVFFQFGGELALAGWLPLFLIRRIGVNPAIALFTLSLYFFSLAFGQWFARVLLRAFRQREVVFAASAVAVCGSAILAKTSTISGVFTALVLIGLGFGPIYPTMARHVEGRFSYTPRFLSTASAVAVIGALVFSWLLGYVCENWGMQYIMAVPAAGSVLVCALVFLMMLESRVMRSKSSAAGLLY